MVNLYVIKQNDSYYALSIQMLANSGLTPGSTAFYSIARELADILLQYNSLYNAAAFRTVTNTSAQLPIGQILLVPPTNMTNLSIGTFDADAALATLQSGPVETLLQHEDVVTLTDQSNTIDAAAFDQSQILDQELQTNIIDVVPEQVTDTLATVGDTAVNIVDTIYTATAADQQDNMATAADQQDTAPAPSTDAEKAARTKKVLLGASVALFLFKLLH